MKKLFTVICLSLLSLSAFSQWFWQNPLPQGNSLNSVYFTAPNTGYSVSDAGTIIKTTDGGTNWTFQSSGTTNYLSSVFFIDANKGYVVGNYGTILKTINGGGNWTSLSSGTSEFLSSVHFPNADT